MLSRLDPDRRVESNRTASIGSNGYCIRTRCYAPFGHTYNGPPRLLGGPRLSRYTLTAVERGGNNRCPYNTVQEPPLCAIV